MFELPVRDPCDLCEGIAGRDEKWAVIDEGDHTLTVINPWQRLIRSAFLRSRTTAFTAARKHRTFIFTSFQGNQAATGASLRRSWRRSNLLAAERVRRMIPPAMPLAGSECRFPPGS